MPGTIQVIIAGIMPITANGSLELRKEPPFGILTPGWAAVATVDMESDVPRIRRVLDFMARQPDQAAPVVVGFRNKWITGDAFCVDRSPIHRGARYTLALARYAWSRPLRLGFVNRRFAA